MTAPLPRPVVGADRLGAPGAPIEILLVEDNPADVRLTREALRTAKLLNALHVVGDGEAALAFLRRRPPYQAMRRPGLVLLDLNLPGIDGRHVLDEIKNDPALRTIPVIVLTTSAARDDVVGSYARHANCYITKPVDFSEFVNAIQRIEEFWLSLVTLPAE